MVGSKFRRVPLAPVAFPHRGAASTVALRKGKIEVALILILFVLEVMGFNLWRGSQRTGHACI